MGRKAKYDLKSVYQFIRDKKCVRKAEILTLLNLSSLQRVDDILTTMDHAGYLTYEDDLGKVYVFDKEAI